MPCGRVTQPGPICNWPGNRQGPVGSPSHIMGIRMFRLADLREMLRYVPQYRDRIFVIAIDGAVVECENFRNLLLDIALLRSLRIGVALVHGAGHQIRRLAEQANILPSNIDGTGVTDAPTLRLALTAATGVTHEI